MVDPTQLLEEAVREAARYCDSWNGGYDYQVEYEQLRERKFARTWETQLDAWAYVTALAEFAARLNCDVTELRDAAHAHIAKGWWVGSRGGAEYHYPEAQTAEEAEQTYLARYPFSHDIREDLGFRPWFCWAYTPQGLRYTTFSELRYRENLAHRLGVALNEMRGHWEPVPPPKEGEEK
jgi:hypothetical protein